MTPQLIQPTGAAHTRIYSYGAARGQNAVPNEDLIEPIEEAHRLCLRIGLAIANYFGAHG